MLIICHQTHLICIELWFFINMIIDELILFLKNKLLALNDKKTSAYANGDIILYGSISEEIEEVQKAIEKLTS